MGYQQGLYVALITALIVVIILGLRRSHSVLDESPVAHGNAVAAALTAGVPAEHVASEIAAAAPGDDARLGSWLNTMGNTVIAAGHSPAAANAAVNAVASAANAKASKRGGGYGALLTNTMGW
jgi:hypothetical protein